MVTISKGCLVKTEPSIKEVICTIGENENFVIENINDTLVFITEEGAKDLKSRVEAILNRPNKDVK
ncbi:transcription factor tfiih complex subunit tfb5 [Vairimorpha ceranae]|uniref:General transcription and DNA repair factor IIH subunit TFB5 n=1 Tax=Vairimorpha ceranae TaxID=40302 RepID=A0A0F9W8S2_9MICR|nr:transcription factor tfiih complex subunit tfb5 [Vairimorpha ceranae]KKO74106.1 transcription factor tfiih complex subunit tfb5 [Vairimorpha ceranae]